MYDEHILKKLKRIFTTFYQGVKISLMFLKWSENISKVIIKAQNWRMLPGFQFKLDLVTGNLPASILHFHLCKVLALKRYPLFDNTYNGFEYLLVKFLLILTSDLDLNKDTRASVPQTH